MMKCCRKGVKNLTKTLLTLVQLTSRIPSDILGVCRRTSKDLHRHVRVQPECERVAPPRGQPQGSQCSQCSQCPRPSATRKAHSVFNFTGILFHENLLRGGALTSDTPREKQDGSDFVSPSSVTFRSLSFHSHIAVATLSPLRTFTEKKQRFDMNKSRRRPRGNVPH